MIAAFKMSLLAAQRQLLADRFAERHPWPWLIWEVASVPPEREKPQSMVSTAMPEELVVPAQADPVCFELKGESIMLGRTPDNDLVMLDATVSRHQLLLRLVGGRYVAAAVPDAAPVLIGATPLELGAAYALNAGDRLRLGGTMLTYLGSAELIARLDEHNKKSSH